LHQPLLEAVERGSHPHGLLLVLSPHYFIAVNRRIVSTSSRYVHLLLEANRVLCTEPQIIFALYFAKCSPCRKMLETKAIDFIRSAFHITQRFCTIIHSVEDR
jgi:hypothetical protein